jgi:uncharacterized protein YndB with AHSA1/START domain
VASEHRVTAETTVPAPLARVWSLVADLHRYADWVESTIEVLRADDEVAPGARYEERTRLSGLWTATTCWTITELQPGARIAFAADGVRAVRDLTLVLTLQQVAGGTAVTSTYAYLTRFGPLGSVLELVVRGNVVNDQRRSLRTLSHLAELDDPAARP